MINLKKYTYSLFFLFSLLFLAACGNESSGLPSQGGDGGQGGDGTIVSLMIMPENPSVAAGETLQLGVKGTQSDGKTIDIDASTVSWFSSDPSIVTVGKDGVMKGIKEGTAEVTAVYQGQETTTTVTILSPKLIGLQVVPEVASIAGGVTLNFMANALYSDGSKQDVTQSATWTSSDTNVATIASPGKVATIVQPTPIDTTITATFDGFSGSAVLTVTNAAVTSLSIDPSTLNIANGTTGKLTATALFDDGTSLDVSDQTTWTVSPAGIADVDSTGLVTGTGPGSAVITGTYGSTSSTANVNVSNATVLSITVSPANVSLANGLTQQFIATANFSDGSNQDVTSSVTWSSVDPTVATIDVNGLATAKAKGSTTITAELQSITSTATLTVSDATLLSLTIDPTSITMAQGDTAAIKVMANYSDGSSQDVTSLATITTDNPAVASINADNSIQAVGAGSANVTAAFNSTQSAPIPVTVTNATVTGITIGTAPFELAQGTTKQLVATATYSDLTTRDVTSEATWSSLDPSIVAVSPSSGLLTASNTATVGATTDVTAGFGGQFETVTVKVTDATFTTLTITPASLNLAKGDSGNLVAMANFTSGDQDVTNSATWNTSDPAIATVTSSGEVQAIIEGTATITATYEGIDGTAQITVGPKRADRLRLNAIDSSGLNILGLLKLSVGDSIFTIESEVFYSDDSSRILNVNEPSYSSDNSQLINIDTSGVVRLANADVIGSANVTATFESLISVNQINVACLAKVELLGITLGLACSIDDTQPNPAYVAP